MSALKRIGLALASMLLLLHFATADPPCRSVCVHKGGGFVAQFRARTGDNVQTGLSGDKGKEAYACWSTQDLLNESE
jgi:hypothetical protein